MNTFFLRHGLVRFGRVPGRYPYDVEGDALDRNAAIFTRQSFKERRIYADGYEATPASNMDPHVLSDVMPWFLSFCLIDKKTDPETDAKRLVAPEKQHRLPELAQRGDLIIFGNYIAKHVIWADSVLSVDHVLTIPQSNGRLNIQEYHRKYWELLGLPELWEDFKETRAYVYNLRDAERPDGKHQFTHGLDPYKQIVGRRLKRGEVASFQKDALLARFVDGQGFNFIPLRTDYENDRQDIKDRPGIFTTRIPDFPSHIENNSVTRINSTASRALLGAIFRDADTLVLDPIEPAKQLPPPDRSGH
ncbi:MAG TPA: hypothetical protein VGM05_33745 [Planctomycetaceae bacterium]